MASTAIPQAPGQPTPQTAQALIESAHARATRARIAVLTALLEAPRALSHHDIEIRIGGPQGVDRVTLYRVLEWLTEQSLAHKVSGEDRVWRFAAADTTGSPVEHAHFECGGCGKVICLESAPLVALPLPPGYVRREVEVRVKGRCDECAIPR